MFIFLIVLNLYYPDFNIIQVLPSQDNEGSIVVGFQMWGIFCPQNWQGEGLQWQYADTSH